METTETNVMRLAFFCQLRVCSVSVVASDVFFMLVNLLFSSKAVQRDPGSPTLMYLGKRELFEITCGVFGAICVIKCYF